MLDGERTPKGRHYPAIDADVVQSQAALLAIFQPLLADLVSADPELVYFPGKRAEILGSVDVQALLIGVIAKALRLRLCDFRVACALEPAGRRIEFPGLEQMQPGQSRAEIGEFCKQFNPALRASTVEASRKYCRVQPGQRQPEVVR